MTKVKEWIGKEGKEERKKERNKKKREKERKKCRNNFFSGWCNGAVEITLLF